MLLDIPNGNIHVRGVFHIEYELVLFDQSFVNSTRQ